MNTTWTRYKHKNPLKMLGGKLAIVKYDVETIAGRPVVYSSPSGIGEECHRIRTVNNFYFQEEGRHIPQFTYMPTRHFKELYSKV